ncbi:MAG TPA: DUF4377 domain-containing protein [Chitinophagales bacterium]|nr:DUF4377 domain-containing protein [Chitinophagales bacterium]
MKKYITISLLILATFTFAQKGKTVSKETVTPTVVEPKTPRYTKDIKLPSDKNPSSNGTITLTVDAALAPCSTDANKQCLQVLRKGATAYESVDDIEGFAYELGYTYTIQVKEILKSPPIGVNESLYRYKWIKTIKKVEEATTETKKNEVPTLELKRPKDDATIFTNENGKKIGKTDVTVNSPLDKKWYLRKIKDADGTNLVTDDNVMFITISTFNDRLEGFGACNKFAAVMRSDLSTSFNVSKLYYDFANCGYKKLENLFFESLQTANKFEVRNNSLILSNQWNFLMAFTSDPNNKEDISTTYVPQNIIIKEDRTIASSEKQETKTYQEPFTPTPIKESTNTTIETKTVTTLDENKQPVTTTNTTVTSDDDIEIQKQIDALKKKQVEKLAAQQKADEDAKIASDKDAELKKRDELKQQELAAAKEKEEKLAKLKADKERLQKELDEMDNGTVVEQKNEPTPTTQSKSTTKPENKKEAKSTVVVEKSKVITNNFPEIEKENIVYYLKDKKYKTLEKTKVVLKSGIYDLGTQESSIQFIEGALPKMMVKLNSEVDKDDFIYLVTCDFKKEKRQVAVKPLKNKINIELEKVENDIYEIILPSKLAVNEYAFINKDDIKSNEDATLACFGIGEDANKIEKKDVKEKLKDVSTENVIIPKKNNSTIIPEPEFPNRPYYLDGNELKSLERIDAQSDFGVKGMGYGGSDLFYSAFGKASTIQFAGNNLPRLFIQFENAIDPNDAIQIYSAIVKKDRRRFKTGSTTMTGSARNVADNKLSIEFKKISNNFYEIILPENVPANEYAIISTQNGTQGYMSIGTSTKINCFGVK